MSHKDLIATLENINHQMAIDGMTKKAQRQYAKYVKRAAKILKQLDEKEKVINDGKAIKSATRPRQDLGKSRPYPWGEH